MKKMCNWKSGELVKTGENECDVLTLEGEDSHTKIREHYKIPEATGTGMADNMHTSIEFVPVRGCKNMEDFDLIYDAGKPEWVTPEMEDRARVKMFEAVKRDLKLTVWLGDLSVSGTATLPKLTSVKGDLTVYGTATLPKLTSVKSDLYVYGTATLPKLTSVKGDLYVSGTATLNAPKLTSVKGDLYVYGTATLPKLKR
jgi:hypothetical protein